MSNPATDPLAGASNDDAEAVLRKHWPVAIQGIIANGLIAGFAAADQTNFNNAVLIFEQLFRSTASSFYLDRRMADFGVLRPPNVGISDDVFRQLGLVITNKKIISEALLQVLNAFYGQDSCRAFVASTQGEPFNIPAGYTLQLQIDGAPSITIPFASTDFANSAQAKSVEVAASITRWLQLNGFGTAYALPYLDPNTGLNLVKIYSGALGLDGSVAVIGGQAQNVLQFPQQTAAADPGDTWVVTVPTPGVTRYTISSNTTTTDLTKVFTGDYVNIFGSNFVAANKGTFFVTRVDVRITAGTKVQFFEVANNGTAQGSVSIVSSLDMVWFRRIRSTINNAGNRAVVVAAVSPGELNVQIPATTVAVSRGPLTAAYANVRAALSVSSAIRLPNGTTTVTTTTPHGLSSGNWFFLDSETPSNQKPADIAGNGFSTTNANPVSTWTSIQDLPTTTLGATADSLQNGKVFVTAGVDDLGNPLDFTTLIQTSAPTVQANGGIRYSYSVTTGAVIPTGAEFMASSVMTDANQNGNVLVTGGLQPLGPTVLSVAYIYNVGGNSWSANIPMTTARYSHRQVTLNDGRVVVFGGADVANNSIITAEIFTPSIGGGTWGAPISMLNARSEFQAVKLSDEKVLIIGGSGNGLTAPIPSCEIFDPGTNTFAATGSLNYSRYNHAAVVLPGDKVLVFGGSGFDASSSLLGPSVLNQAEIFDYSVGRWYPAGVAHFRANPVGVYLSASNTVVALNNGNYVDIFDVATRTWQASASGSPRQRILSNANLDSFGNIIYTGGYTGTAIDIYQPAGNQISGGGINGLHAVASVSSPTVFTFQTPEDLDFTADAGGIATILPVGQLPALKGQPGPYVWDTQDGPALSNVATTLTQAIKAGQHLAALQVASTTGFPDQDGFLCIGFGTSFQLFPVHYAGVNSSVLLSLDYDTNFPVDIPSGAEVTLLTQKGPWTPPNPTQLGSFYLTDTATGRISAETTIQAITAAGINTDIDIVYPGDRGLGGEGLPVSGAQKLSDAVEVWAGDNIDSEVAAARSGESEAGEGG